MKSTELRIGNFLLTDYDYLVEVELIAKNHFACRETTTGNFVPNGKYKPIPLTEEWLLKFGFEEIIGNVENSKCFRHPKCSLIVYFDGIRLSVNFWQGNEKKYVHQLQNFYFALTNKELELI